MECVSCRAGLDHCHGTLIIHLDSHPECTDQRCASPVELRHRLIIDCESVDGGCYCTAQISVESLRRAS